VLRRSVITDTSTTLALSVMEGAIAFDSADTALAALAERTVGR